MLFKANPALEDLLAEMTLKNMVLFVVFLQTCRSSEHQFAFHAFEIVDRSIVLILAF
jgi:hypothetical protein